MDAEHSRQARVQYMLRVPKQWQTRMIFAAATSWRAFLKRVGTFEYARITVMRACFRRYVFVD